MHVDGTAECQVKCSTFRRCQNVSVNEILSQNMLNSSITFPQFIDLCIISNIISKFYIKSELINCRKIYIIQCTDRILIMRYLQRFCSSSSPFTTLFLKDRPEKFQVFFQFQNYETNFRVESVHFKSVIFTSTNALPLKYHKSKELTVHPEAR